MPNSNGKFTWDAFTIRIYLMDTGTDLTDELADQLSDTINDWMNASVRGLQEKLIHLFPDYQPEVEYKS